LVYADTDFFLALLEELESVTMKSMSSREVEEGTQWGSPRP